MSRWWVPSPSCLAGTFFFFFVEGLVVVWGTSLPFALGVSGLEDAGGGHEVLDVLTEDLVLGL